MDDLWQSALLKEMGIAFVLSVWMGIGFVFYHSTACLAASWNWLSCKLALHTSHMLVLYTHLTVLRMVINVYDRTKKTTTT